MVKRKIKKKERKRHFKNIYILFDKRKQYLFMTNAECKHNTEKWIKNINKTHSHNNLSPWLRQSLLHTNLIYIII